eukprot:10176616-Alexandrium_andersonii.AAC.1
MKYVIASALEARRPCNPELGSGPLRASELGDAADSELTNPRRSRLGAREQCNRSSSEPLGSSGGPQSWGSERGNTPLDGSEAV